MSKTAQKIIQVYVGKISERLLFIRHDMATIRKTEKENLKDNWSVSALQLKDVSQEICLVQMWVEDFKKVLYVEGGSYMTDNTKEKVRGYLDMIDYLLENVKGDIYNVNSTEALEGVIYEIVKVQEYVSEMEDILE